MKGNTMKKTLIGMAAGAILLTGCGGSSAGYACEKPVKDDTFITDEGDDFVESIIVYDNVSALDDDEDMNAVIRNFGFNRSVKHKMEQTRLADGKQTEENEAGTHELTWSYDGRDNEQWVLIEGPMPDSFLCGDES